ncbi:fucolectin-like [Haliotis asinina]|uniref:fucolectin-like n=1 Tax=Haliotis asinina TaxID=109174 RepID=UPI003531E050
MSLRQKLHVKWCTNIGILLCCSLVDATPNNVALGKPVYNSTNYPLYSQPSQAVDGNTDNNWAQGSCFGTVDDDQPWWMVDLLSTYTIGNITIYNRGDCCWERLHDVTVEVFSVNPVRCPTATPTVCKELLGQLPLVTHITCDQEVIGRFVQIRKEAVDKNDNMMFCEIEITGISQHSECEQTVFPVMHGDRLEQATVGNPFFANSRSECVKSCYDTEGCVGGNFRQEDNTCEMISSPSSNGRVLMDSHWDYFGNDMC